MISVLDGKWNILLLLILYLPPYSCNVYEDCNAGRSAYGCQRVVSNGRYT